MTHKSDEKQQHEGEESTPLTIAEIEDIAQTKLRKQVWDYYVSGSDEQASASRNREAYNKYVILPYHVDIGKV